MFDINFESEYKPRAFHDKETNHLKFEPPVYEQRYSAVLRCLQLKRWSGHFKKIVEFGCAEMRLLVFLKTLPGIEQILQVDIDKDLLERNKYKAEPLICDFLREREKQLKVDVYCGSIDTESDCLLNTDVVIGIEIIEHLYPATIENVPYNIFGFMKPKLALFTTPNSDCNILFNMKTQFRHDDHKFEWTREQFHDWGHNICVRFPDYKVAFYGIGPGPDGREELGCCSQMALFVREDFLELTSTNCNDIHTDVMPSDNKQLDLPETPKIESDFHLSQNSINGKNNHSNNDTVSLNVNDFMDDKIIDQVGVKLATTHIDSVPTDYQLIRSCIYPRNWDERSQEEQIFQEACFHLGRYMNMDDEHYDPDDDIIKVPIKNIFDLVYKYTTDIDEFRRVMHKNNYKIDENDVFIIKPIESSDGDDDDDLYPETTQNASCAYEEEEEEEEDWN